jgi:hypothetical protein
MLKINTKVTIVPQETKKIKTKDFSNVEVIFNHH